MNTQIYEEATHWLIKHREADLSPQEKREFDAWLRESPQHVRAYLEMSAVWEMPTLDPSWNPSPDQLIARVRSEGNVYPLAAADTARRVLRPEERALKGKVLYPPIQVTGEGRDFRSGKGEAPTKFFTLAATLLITIVSVASWYWLNRNTYATDIGEQRSIVLADGSTVELNSRSRVRIRYTDAQRDVDLLEGQALFRVAHDTARPFIVHSGTANVRAVGTQFDVYKKRAGTIVTVVEGKIAVLASTLSRLPDSSSPRERSGGQGNEDSLSARPAAGEVSSGTAVGAAVSDVPIALRSTSALASQAALSSGDSNAVFLVAGEQLTVPAVKRSRAGNPSADDSPQRANVAAAIAWTHRTLVFESSPLTDVAEEFNRYNTRQLVIKAPELTNIHISGMFSSVDPALLLKFLRTQPELNVEETETEIRISKK